MVQLLTLHEVRGYLRRSHGVGLAMFIAVAYALGSMVIGGMLTFARFSGGYSVLVLWGNALGLQPWNYPGLLIEAPWGFIELPFFATIAMVLVSIGVGLGMAVAVFLGAHLIRVRKASAGRPTATGAIAGLTPAMIALVTLGACCSTTAAATAGVGLVAQASGSSTSNLLLNNWFLGVFQIVVVYVALLAQELLLRVYGSMFGASDPGFSAMRSPESRPVDRRTVASAALRISLVAAGITWGLAVLADWTVVSPASATAGMWFNWVVEHWLLSGVAVFVALAPRPARALFIWLTPRTSGYVVRSVLLVGAWSLAVWVPPPVSGTGAEGFGNELLGLLGAGSNLGAVAPAMSWGVVLLLRWVFQYLLLGSFAAAIALSPRRTLDWISDVDRVPNLAGAAGPIAPATPGVPADPR